MELIVLAVLTAILSVMAVEFGSDSRRGFGDNRDDRHEEDANG